ncbi:MAG: hydrogenase small subunit [Candidatus Bipolaricaulota bacterium]
MIGGVILDTKQECCSVIWLQGAACTGCAISLMNSNYPKLSNLLLDEVVPGKSISLKFMATLMGATGELALEVLSRAEAEGDYIVVMEGSVPKGEDGKYCMVGEKSVADQLTDAAPGANAVVSIGTCSAYGGIPAGQPNPTDAVSAAEHLEAEGIDTPCLNVPGCPPEPSWFVDSLATVMLFGLPGPEDVDDVGRLKSVYGELIHDNCPRRGDFQNGHFARHIGEEGCLAEVGCKGPYANAPCPNRGWHEGLNWAIKNNHPCIGCVEPGFPDLMGPFFEKFGPEESEEMYRRLK